MANRKVKKSSVECTHGCEQRKNVTALESVRIEQQIQHCVDNAFADKLRLESYIKNETRVALLKVTGFIGIILGFITITGFFGWNQIVERVSTNAAAKVANDVALTAARELIQTSVSGMISNSVPDMIDDIVPRMILDRVDKTERQLKKEITKYVEGQFVRLEANEKSIMDLYRKTEEQLSLVPVMAEARAGNRVSYEKLKQTAKENPSLSLFIDAAINEVDAQYQSKKSSYYRYNITLKAPGSRKLDLVDYVEIVNADNEWNCDGAINDLVATGRKEFVSSLVRLVQGSKRLDSVYLAIVGIEKLTNKAFRPLDIQGVLQWWNTAKMTLEYHSPYQEFCDLRHEFNDKSLIVTTNKVAFHEFISKFDILLNRVSDCSAVPEYILAIVAYSPFQKEFICAENSIFKRALDMSSKMPFGKTDKWYCYKALYDAYHGALYDGINARLKVSQSFAEELRRSGLFNNSLFEQDSINWTGKSKTNDDDHRKEDLGQKSSESIPPPSNVLGYITVKIKPGKHILPLPFVRADGTVKERLDSKIIYAKDGDTISWTIDQQTYCYTYDGKHWISENGEEANDIEIPVGQCDISYERIKDEESEMSFAGVVSL